VAIAGPVASGQRRSSHNASVTFRRGGFVVRNPFTFALALDKMSRGLKGNGATRQQYEGRAAQKLISANLLIIDGTSAFDVMGNAHRRARDAPRDSSASSNRSGFGWSITSNRGPDEGSHVVSPTRGGAPERCDRFTSQKGYGTLSSKAESYSKRHPQRARHALPRKEREGDCEKCS